MARVCSSCGNKVEVVLTVSPTGKKRMRRLCCEE
jgi:ribosomal protein L28